jgi:hypothetical protein
MRQAFVRDQVIAQQYYPHLDVASAVSPATAISSAACGSPFSGISVGIGDGES